MECGSPLPLFGRVCPVSIRLLTVNLPTSACASACASAQDESTFTRFVSLERAPEDSALHKVTGLGEPGGRVCNGIDSKAWRPKNDGVLECARQSAAPTPLWSCPKRQPHSLPSGSQTVQRQAMRNLESEVTRFERMRRFGRRRTRARPEPASGRRPGPMDFRSTGAPGFACW